MTIRKDFTDAVPDILETSFTYFENNYKLDLGTADKLLSLDLSINDPYDPYASIGGKSANLFAQLMALYRYCRVFKAEIKVVYVDTPDSNACPIQTALVYNSEGVSYADMDDLISLPLSKRIVQLRMNNRIGTSVTLQGTFFPYQGFLMTRQQWFNQAAGSGYDVTNIGSIASPTNLSIVSLYYGRVDESNTNAIATRATISVRYHCRLYDRQSFTE